jgi:hypothetical protein
MPNPNTRLTAMQATSYLGVSRSLLQRFMDEGSLIGRRVHGTWEFTISDLDACQAKRKLLWDSMNKSLMVVIHRDIQKEK